LPPPKRWPRWAVEHRVQFAGTMFSVFFTDAPVHDYDAARTQRLDRYAAFFHAMLEHGVYPAAVGLRGLVPLRPPMTPTPVGRVLEAFCRHAARARRGG